ncbi:alpha/beta fold hydrolase [Halobacillus litoralis]|uniref:Alpha/beta fold hydrolase n=1 Tax=Halobacillus litoralis TaxID=45668 RepID=A0A845FD80_9BACI|nr:alpha/beta fold hydrolase [Halobacillus litoralis]MYL71758.1 alpha/beta fold hydrolase [Halobacillus litoralis]
MVHKTPLLLLPGTLCDERLWKHQLASLDDIANMTVIDLTGATSIKELAHSVLEGAPDTFALAGLSLGGIVAMEVVRQAPERVSKIALLHSNPYAPRPEQLETWDHLEHLVEQGRFMEVFKEKLLPNLIHPNRQQDERLVSTIVSMAEKIGPEAYIRQLKAVATRSDARQNLEQLQCDTLLLTGRQDNVCPPAFHEEMEQLIPNSTLKVIDQCGHLSSLEQPEAVSGALRAWLLETPEGRNDF